jgi:3-hydroxyacyl-CoA dehydrogenase
VRVSPRRFAVLFSRTIAMNATPQIGPESHVAIIGAGSIGTAFALVFATAGRTVALYDPDAARLQAAPETMRQRLVDLAEFGLVEEQAADVLGRITTRTDLGEALRDASYVQECAPENLELKRNLFAELDAFAAPGAILASASSAIPASHFAADVPGRHRCLVVHPGNPPT